MKKRLSIIFVSLIAILISFNSIKNVIGAPTTFAMSITGSETVTKGNQIVLSLKVDPSGLSSGVISYQNTITFDDSKLEFVSMTSSIEKWDATPNLQGNKIYVLGAQKLDLTAPVIRSQMETAKITFKALSTASGSATITVSDIEGSDENFNSLSAAATSKTLTIGEPVVTKSSDATLSRLVPSVGTLSPAFVAGNTTYSLSIPNDCKNITFDYATSNSKASVSKITGNTDLKVGLNPVSIEVTAEDGSKKIYTVNVTRTTASNSSGGNNNPSSNNPSGNGGGTSNNSGSNGGSTGNNGGTSKTPSKSTTSPSKSSNNNLKSISGIDGLNFSPSVTDYSIEVPNEITELNISAVPENSKAKVAIKNSHLTDLKVGEVKTVVITVTAENSAVKIYTVNVKRGATKSETDLEKLAINDQSLIEDGVQKGNLEITVPYNTDELSIEAIPKSSGSVVKIKGNTNLKNGDNKVVVEVTDKNGYTKSYTINVKKEPKNALFNFIDKYWILLLLLPLVVLLTLMHLYFKNERIIDELDENQDDLDERKALEKGLMMRNDIDNKNDMLYNSNDRVDSYDKTDIDNLMNDDTVSDFEVKLVRNGNDSRKYRRR